MRRNQALGLRWGDVDFQKKRISLIRGLITIGSELHPTWAKSRYARRPSDPDLTTPSRPSAVEGVTDRRAHLGVDDDCWVFTDSNGQPVHPKALSQGNVCAPGPLWLPVRRRVRGQVTQDWWIEMNARGPAPVYLHMHTRMVSTGLVGAAAAAVMVLGGCGTSSSKSQANATTTAAPAAPPPAAPTTKVTGTAFSPEKGSIQGVSGKGMVVDLAFRSADASAIQGSFRLGGALPAPATAVKPGHNPAFPGLVVTLSTTAAANGGPAANLANLFQIVSTSKQTDGTTEIWATWTNAKPGFGVDVDSQLDAYTVSGDAPDVVRADRTGVTLTSNMISVPFHLAGPKPTPAPTTTAP